MTRSEFISRVGAKGQITIPIEIRRRLGIRPRDRVAFRMDDGRVTIAPAVNAFLAAAGSLPALSPSRTLNEMTEIAAEEAALKAARDGLDYDDRRASW